MIFYKLFNYFRRYFIPNRPGKVTVLPELSAPKFFLYFRVLLEYYTRTDILQHSYYLGNAMSGWKRQKYMNMVFCYFKRFYIKIMAQGYLLKYLLNSLLDIFSQNPFAILWSPYQMILRIIYRMTRSSKRHALNIPNLPLPTAEKLFIPVYKTGYLSYRIS